MKNFNNNLSCIRALLLCFLTCLTCTNTFSKVEVSTTKLHKIGKGFCSALSIAFEHHKLQIVFDERSPASTKVLFDINGDGIQEKISMAPSNEAYRPYTQVSESDGSEIQLRTPVEIEGYADSSAMAMATFKGRPYILFFQEANLRAVTWADKDFNLALLCEFKTVKYKTGRVAALELSPYEKIVARAKRLNISNLYFDAISRKNKDEIRLLHRSGVDVNASYGDINPVQYAVWQLNDDDADALSVIELLLNLGANPDRGGTSALYCSVWYKKPAMARLLFSRTSTVNTISIADIIRFMPDGAGARLIQDHIRIKKEIATEVVAFAIDGGHFDLISYVAAQKIPWDTYIRNFINGGPSKVPSYIYKKIQTLPQRTLRIALMKKTESKSFSKLALINSEFLRLDQAFVVRENYWLYKDSRPNDTLEFSVAICMHLLGWECGSEAVKQRAETWLAKQPKSLGGRAI